MSRTYAELPALMTRMTGDEKHGPSATSTLDVLWVLYDKVLRVDSPLGYHPDRNLIPGVEIASGSLGHGLPLAVGVALGLRARGLTRPRVFVLVGDAELDEGSNNEAIVYAGAAGLPNLTAIAVDNQSATYGWGPGGIESHFAASGWSTVRVDGREHAELFAALSTGPGSSRAPRLVVAAVEAKW